jgi:hypothetical protein
MERWKIEGNWRGREFLAAVVWEQQGEGNEREGEGRRYK